MKLLPILFIFFFVAVSSGQMPKIEPGVSHDLAKWRSVNYSDVRYKLNLTLEKMSPVLKGTIEIRMQQAAYSCAECPSMYIILDWRKIPGHEKESTISNVTLNGKAAALPAKGAPIGAVSYTESNEHLIFEQGVVMGENVIRLDFTSPILTSGSAITRYIDKEDGSEYLYSLFVPSDASTAFPVFDQPDLKARFTLSVSAPKSWKVVGNAEMQNQIIVDGICGLPVVPPSTKRLNNVPAPIPSPPAAAPEPCGMSDIWLFKETKPISTYVFAFAAGPWQQFTDAGAQGGNPSGSEGAPKYTGLTGTLPTGRVSASDADLPSHIYVRKSQAAKFKPHAAEVFRLTCEGVRYLENYFDYKFPWPKYDLVLIPEFPFGGMEHAGATFLRESSVIFPTAPTANDYISRANLIFHETAHQWFGDTVTMKWFDDLWLKEGFAEFMAYRTLQKVMPQFNAWKVFYERNKQAAYLTDSTKGTTPIYQEIANLSAAKSAYGNIVYRKAPSFLRQAEFYLGEDKFQTAVRAFLKKHAFANAGWEDLVKEFEVASGRDLKDFANGWVKRPGLPLIKIQLNRLKDSNFDMRYISQQPRENEAFWTQSIEVLSIEPTGSRETQTVKFQRDRTDSWQLPIPLFGWALDKPMRSSLAVIPNYQDYGYGIFLLDDKSRDYVLKNIQNEKDDFLRTMMWGSLWDSVREAELDPRDYVELVVKNIALEKDEGTIQSLLARVSTAMNCYLPSPGGTPAANASRARVVGASIPTLTRQPADLQSRLETILFDRMQHSSTAGQRITYYRSFLDLASTDRARDILKDILRGKLATSDASGKLPVIQLKTKDKFDIVTRLAILGDPEAPKLLADLERTESSDDAKRYAYAANAGFATAANKAKYWNDFLTNKTISESWIESAILPFNSVRHAALTQQYLRRALEELPNLKRTRKIFFINNWLGAVIGGQRDEAALAMVNKFLGDNPDLDRDLRLKVLENVDLIERAVKIRNKFGK